MKMRALPAAKMLIKSMDLLGFVLEICSLSDEILFFDNPKHM
jgi:hypothetical protein